MHSRVVKNLFIHSSAARDDTLFAANNKAVIYGYFYLTWHGIIVESFTLIKRISFPKMPIHQKQGKEICSILMPLYKVQNFLDQQMSEKLQYCRREIRATLKEYIISLITLILAAVLKRGCS